MIDAEKIVKEMLDAEKAVGLSLHKINCFLHGKEVDSKYPMEWVSPKQFRLGLFQKLNLPRGEQMKLYSEEQRDQVEQVRTRAEELCSVYRKMYDMEMMKVL